ncbi:AEC family transporter [Chitinilyticum piscinae]|uniref:AEC family transporter n=1 Tax=Chitinilyticum piscinae TaxID=2866724 RepID=A0A8J7KAE0_9NEIS|nr:AEC family transporter [Chitinilyticum piscinae]MBE9609034.1 AEC family transporter [Chitinilyticum piscinae]
MPYQIFSIIAPVLLLALAGWAYARWRSIDLAALNRLNIELLSPLLVFTAMTQRPVHWGAYGPLLLAVLVVTIGSGLLAWLVARLLRLNVPAFVVPQMFTNTGNMGLPLWLFAFGAQEFAAAVVIFVTLSLLHFTVGIRLFNRGAPLASMLNTPMVWALLAGIAVQQLAIPMPIWVFKPMEMLGSMAIPLMLFSLGVRMAQFRVTRWGAGLLAGLLCPVSGLLLAWLCVQLWEFSHAQAGILLLYGALPPAVINYLFAEQYRQDPELVAAIVVAGTLLSLLFVPLALALGLR